LQVRAVGELSRGLGVDGSVSLAKFARRDGRGRRSHRDSEVSEAVKHFC
jgi:hypothetical protein